MQPYHVTLCVLVGLVLLWSLQAMVAGLASIRAKHVPGMPITSGHDDRLYRITRAQLNTNENLPAFAIAAFLAMGLGASKGWVNGVAVTYFVARVAHMILYYADIRGMRSNVYTLGLLATAAMGVLAALKL